MKQADLKDTLKKVSKSVHIFTIATSADTLSPTPSMSTAMTVPKTNKMTLMTLNQQMKEIPK
jgi:hypothetical protein